LPIVTYTTPIWRPVGFDPVRISPRSSVSET